MRVDSFAARRGQSRAKSGSPRVPPPALAADLNDATQLTEEYSPLTSFFRDSGVRETIESIVVAIMLALMFKAFEAEAYIIPTGSMAPTLRGEHFDVVCEQCGERFLANCSSKRTDVRSVYCPICRYRTVLAPERFSDHSSFDGDRILVNKFIYDFADPERWDVIVFKNPKNAKQNYIKRLCGLPNESLLIERGDIYTFDPRSESFAQRRIARKSPAKMRAMMQLVDDSVHVGKKLQQASWPARWVESRGPEAPPLWNQAAEPAGGFEIDARQSDDIHWLRYRHLQPRIEDWDWLNDGQLPARIEKLAASGIRGGGLVRDHYSYNEFNAKTDRGLETSFSGLHWVGDLGIEAWVDIRSADGTLLLEATEGGARFICRIDLATGTVSLDSSSSAVRFVDRQGADVESPTGVSSARGPGAHRLLFMNADNRLFLWVDNRPVDFGGVSYQDYERDEKVRPQYSAQDDGDSLPLGIGVERAKVSVSRLKVWRDVYYTSVTPRMGGSDYRLNVSGMDLNEVLDDPSQWHSREAAALFDSQERGESDLHQLGEGQYFPMGDNSPASQDARLWGDPPYVTRDLLLGRGLFLYWPHSLNHPFFGFPDFSRMKFIR